MGNDKPVTARGNAWIDRPKRIQARPGPSPLNPHPCRNHPPRPCRRRSRSAGATSPGSLQRLCPLSHPKPIISPAARQSRSVWTAAASAPLSNGATQTTGTTLFYHQLQPVAAAQNQSMGWQSAHPLGFPRFSGQGAGMRMGCFSLVGFQSPQVI